LRHHSNSYRNLSVPCAPDYLFSELSTIYAKVRISMEALERLPFLASIA